MGKKKEKVIEETVVEEVVFNEGDVLNACATSLDTAFTYAVEHRDVEAMLAVSDRWLRLYTILAQIEEGKESPLKLGFIDDSQE
jgi:hypothetical protein